MVDEPIVVLTSARSGSTLLRSILDNHPQLACPPETNVVKLCSQLASLFRIVGGRSTSIDPQRLAEIRVRSVIDDAFSAYLERRGKQRWCDKSLGTAQVAEWFLKIYPKAKFICLYRHCMDVIHSGLEASPWGLIGYGFEQFAGNRSGNSVSSLASYWIEHTGRIYDFQCANRDRCITVRYENLVDDPEGIAGEIFSFIGVDPAPGVTVRCLAGTEDDDALGPGDHKIRATRRITADSVGRGIQVPVGMIPVPQLKIINNLLAKLGYTPVDEAWRRSVCPPRLLTDGIADEDDNGTPTSFGDGMVRSVLENIGRVFCARIIDGFARGQPSVDLDEVGDGATFGLVAYHADRHRVAQSWHVDLHTRMVTQVEFGACVDRQPDWFVTGDVETWLGVLAGRANMASCIRSGRLRYVAPRDGDGQIDDAQELGVLAARIENRLTVVRELLGVAGYVEEIGP